MLLSKSHCLHAWLRCCLVGSISHTHRQSRGISKFGGLISAHTRENPGNQLGNFETSQLKLHTNTDVQFILRRSNVDHKFANSKNGLCTANRYGQMFVVSQNEKCPAFFGEPKKTNRKQRLQDEWMNQQTNERALCIFATSASTFSVLLFNSHQNILIYLVGISINFPDCLKPSVLCFFFFYSLCGVITCNVILCQSFPLHFMLIMYETSWKYILKRILVSAGLLLMQYDIHSKQFGRNACE